ncbi:MAG: histidine kinase dimerization/phospho-acceptor domain-containing protein [Anaeromyxobacteraceae bacterium]
MAIPARDAARLEGGSTPDGAARSLEHALRSEALATVAAGVAHDVKNPLNAMALQVALLGEKLGDAANAAGHLAAIREQIGRVNEVVRRLLDVVDPSGPLGLDVGALLRDAAALLGHEARRRRVAVQLVVPDGAVRCGGDPARIGRLVLAVVAATVADVPDDGRVEVRVRREGREVLVELARSGGAPGPGLTALAAAEPGGALAIHEGAEGVVITIGFEGEERP